MCGSHRPGAHRNPEALISCSVSISIPPSTPYSSYIISLKALVLLAGCRADVLFMERLSGDARLLTSRAISSEGVLVASNPLVRTL